MTDYKPTTAQIRESATNYKNITWTTAEFDRWLAERDAEISRQSPASTTAADLSERVEKRLRTEWPGTKIPARFGYVPPEIREGGATDTFIHLVARVIREEVAAPEGDGGNE